VKKTVAIVVDNYFEKMELEGPKKALEEAGVEVEIIATQGGSVYSMVNAKIGRKFKVDTILSNAKFDDYDALVLPGGCINADHLRMVPKVRRWIQVFLRAGKPVAIICHAPWVLVSAGEAKGRKLTSYFTIQDDMKNAGAEWVDEPVVIDKNLITSRQPDDIPLFNKALIKQLDKKLTSY
jgi:protease I